MKKVSVIIFAGGAENLIRESIESVLDQTYPDVEVVLVDDGSSDGIKEALSPIADKIKYIRSEKANPAHAKNLGIEKSLGDFICFLDPGDRFLPEKVERQAKYLNEHKNLGWIFSDAHLIGGGSMAFQESFFDKLPVFSGFVFPRLFVEDFIPPITVMIKRDVLERSGHFDEDERFFKIEDYELFLRIAMHYPIGYINDRLAIYRLRSQSDMSNFEVNIEKNYLILDKYRREFPELGKKHPGIFKKKLARLMVERGKKHLYAFDYREARRSFFRALKKKAFSKDAVIGYVSALLRLPVFSKISDLSKEYNKRGCYFLQQNDRSLAFVFFMNSVITFPLQCASYRDLISSIFGFGKRRFIVGDGI